MKAPISHTRYRGDNFSHRQSANNAASCRNLSLIDRILPAANVRSVQLQTGRRAIRRIILSPMLSPLKQNVRPGITCSVYRRFYGRPKKSGKVTIFERHCKRPSDHYTSQLRRTAKVADEPARLETSGSKVEEQTMTEYEQKRDQN